MAYTVYMHRFPNQKTYIGITCQSVSRRWRDGRGYEGQPVHDAIKKYGWDNIEHIILETNLTKEQSEDAERFYIKKYNSLSHDDGYNIEKGGYVVDALSDETKTKISKKRKGQSAGQNHWHYGQHWDEQTKQKISASHKGMKYSEETLKKKRERFAGAKNPMYGRKMPPEHKAKLQEACVRATSKAVICIETGEVFKSSAEAQRKMGINSRGILYVCNHDPRYERAGGFHWRFREEVI